MNVIFTCGGTAGHINPAIAVANILKERHPDCNILFIGAKGCMEEKLIPKAGFRLEALPASGLSRKGGMRSIRSGAKAMRNIMRSTAACKKIIKEFKPDVIVGTGGYASFPALYVGSKMGIPTCVHESNAVPGLTTKMVSNMADCVMVCFAESAQYYKHPEQVEVVGMPVRKEFLTTTKADARRELGLEDKPVVVSAFGSQGAKAMNQMTAELMKLEQENAFPFRHIHATGTFGWEWMPEQVKALGVDLDSCDSIDMREYIYNMPQVMAVADVIIGRAGSSSCNEFGVSGTPCILIPSPNVTNDHQTKNARLLESRGAAVLLTEAECSAQKLYDTIMELLEDPRRRKEMSLALRGMVVVDAAEQMCDRIEALVKH